MKEFGSASESATLQFQIIDKHLTIKDGGVGEVIIFLSFNLFKFE